MAGLLECMRDEVGCQYLSDLRVKENEPVVRMVLRKREPEEYDLEEWCDAWQYLFGVKVEFQNYEEIRRAMEAM